jgi:c-di-GMP-binding flagellar brake protein YcgR
MSGRTAERRENPRTDLRCAVSLYNRAGKLIVRAKTVNISDGGMLVSIPVRALPKLEDHADATLSVPRSTPTTHMLEDFACPVRVVRHQPMVDERFAGVALAFDEPQELSLEV